MKTTQEYVDTLASTLADSAFRKMSARGYGPCYVVFNRHDVQVVHDDRPLPDGFTIGATVRCSQTRPQMRETIYNALRRLPILPPELCQ